MNAYRRAVISPVFVPQLDCCAGEYRTASGTYAVSWSRADDRRVFLSVTVPDGCSAELRLTGYRVETEGSDACLRPGSYRLCCLKSETPA